MIVPVVLGVGGEGGEENVWVRAVVRAEKEKGDRWTWSTPTGETVVMDAVMVSAGE